MRQLVSKIWRPKSNGSAVAANGSILEEASEISVRNPAIFVKKAIPDQQISTSRPPENQNGTLPSEFGGCSEAFKGLCSPFYVCLGKLAILWASETVNRPRDTLLHR